MHFAPALYRSCSFFNKYRICTELAQGIFFVAFEISAEELPCSRGAAESPIDAAYQIGSL